MPTTRHVSQTSGGSCYKLIARLRDCAQTVELNGFRSIPEAQAGLAGFVIETAQLGEISDLCLERRDGNSNSNAATEATLIKRWDAEFAARILRQQNLHRQATTTDPMALPAAHPAPAISDLRIPEESQAAAPAPPNFHPERPVEIDGRVPVGPAFEVRSALDSRQVVADAALPENPRCEVEPIRLLAEAAEPHIFAGRVAGQNDAAHRSPIAETRPAKYSRPAGNHRRTRWELAIAIFLTAAVAFTILLWDSGGDPISLFMPRSAASIPRDSLPFQVRPASSRNSASPSPTDP